MPSNAAITFSGPGTVAIEERPMPEPGPDEVLVETTRTLVSTGTELANLVEGDDTYVTDEDWDPDYPFEPGYCNVGTAIEAGADVEGHIVGRRVASYGPHAAYVTATEPSPTADGFGTYRPIPDPVPDEAAAFFTLAEIVMNGLRRGAVTWGEAVAVFGLGVLGHLAVRLARFAGARAVIGLDPAASRREFLPDDPRIAGVDPDVEDPAAAVRERLDGDLADVAVELTGSPAAIPEEPAVLRDQGRFVLLGSPRGETTFDFHGGCHGPGHTIVGAHNRTHPPVATPGDPWTQERHAELFFDLLSTGDLDVGTLITHRYPAAEATAAYDMLLEDRTQALGVIFEWD